MRVADVGEPFDLGRHVGEFLKFGGGEQPVGGQDFLSAKLAVDVAARDPPDEFQARN